MKKYSLLLFVVLFFIPAYGECLSQTITLKPGWNAIYMTIQPDQNKCAEIFNNIPINSVWAWNRQFNSVQFIQDLNTLVPEQPEWLTFFPSHTGKSFLSNLYTIQGGKAYLINLEGDQSFTLEIIGDSVIPYYDWRSDSFNLVGFHIDSTSPPTFKKYLSHSPAHADQPVYQLNDTSQWVKIENLDSVTIQSGAAYWVYCKGRSVYKGPCYPVLEKGIGFDFGKIMNERYLTIKNDTTLPNDIEIKVQSSRLLTESTKRTVTGNKNLIYWNTNELKWITFPETLQMTIPAKSEIAFRIGMNRSATPQSQKNGYQGIITLKDNEGTYLTIPVSAESLPADRTGLWTGVAVIKQVSNPNDDNPTQPQPTASEFQIRLIVHIDENNQARLLQQVTLLWKPGTRKPDPDNPEYTIVDKPGEYVLITKDSLLSQYSGAAVRDNKQVGRRLSSAAFVFTDPVLMTGNVNTSLKCTINIDYDHPLNPFKHKYHPDHDNLGYDFEKTLPEGKESFTIKRYIELQFTEDDPAGIYQPVWGDTQIGGVYREHFEGLHKSALYVEGTFLLNLVSRVSMLNEKMYH